MKATVFFLMSILASVASYADPLPVHEAFPAEVQIFDPNTVVIHWHIAPGYFLYKDRIKIDHIEQEKTENQAAREVQAIQATREKKETKEELTHVGPLHLPTASTKIDKMSHAAISIYRDNLSISIPVLHNHFKELRLLLHFQGCSDEGFCYPPEVREIILKTDPHVGLVKAEMIAEETPDPEAAFKATAPTVARGQSNITNGAPVRAVSHSPELSSTNTLSNAASTSEHFPLSAQLDRVMALNSPAFTFLLFFGLGILLAFTPCVLPMIPVLSGIILGQGKHLSTGRAFLLSASYVLSMALTYALIGATVTYFGSNLQVMLQSPLVIIAFGSFFFILSLSMFGYYDLKLPQTWQGKLTGIQSKQRRGSYFGAAVMGSLSTLILSPCVTAPLVGALSYIAQTGQIFFGTLTLFFMGLGMGTPLLLIGTSAGKWLPKAGPWMNKIKIFFGLLLIAVAIHLISRAIPVGIIAIMWTALFVFAGILLCKNVGKKKWRYALSVLCFLYGGVILFDVNLLHHHERSPLLAPIDLVLHPNVEHSSSSPFLTAKTVTTLKALEENLSQLKGKLVILDFYADWCFSCQLMENTTFRDPALGAALQNLAILKVDLTNSKQTKTLLQKFQVVAPPTFLFLDQQGKECKNLRLIGEHSALQFLRQLNQLKGVAC